MKYIFKFIYSEYKFDLDFFNFEKQTLFWVNPVNV